MELRVYLDPERPLSFVDATTLPAQAPDSFPWLVGVSGRALRARSGSLRGRFSEENPTITVDLANDGRQASTLLGQPLRVPAEVFDDAGNSQFVGLIQSLAYGTKLTLELAT